MSSDPYSDSDDGSISNMLDQLESHHRRLVSVQSNDELTGAVPVPNRSEWSTLSKRLSDFWSQSDVRRAVTIGTAVGIAYTGLTSCLFEVPLRVNALFGGVLGTQAAAASMLLHTPSDNGAGDDISTPARPVQLTDVRGLPTYAYDSDW